ncbi:MAG TPA: TetR/AcrR family transcriptional regulator [Solirubrobacteraceae bacterium]|nr:TetR/AcrR family transcriptional regulator [Solirubrobacteraceae bacterium]
MGAASRAEGGGGRQQQRSAATRAKLIKAARALFAKRGYADVATEEIVRRAGVTRGALYHQFPAKDDLFLAVYEQVEQELTERVAGSLGTIAEGSSPPSPLAAMRAGARAFLEECRAPEVQRIVLIDGPSILGWERWREVADSYGLGLIEAVVRAALDAGEIDGVDPVALAHVLMGALDEAALLVVREPGSTDAVAATIERLLDGLRAR